MGGELILIVEDQPLNRKLVRDILQATGYQTLEAETGEDGVRMARDHKPQLILMDIQLPGASAMQKNKQEILESGFDGYQPKPISVTAFLDAVKAKLA
jgi:CheY-like chemotaxis protein